MTEHSKIPKKPYETPRLEQYGSLEELTRWVGGHCSWGEIFGGPPAPTNPWQSGSSFSS